MPLTAQFEAAHTGQKNIADDQVWAAGPGSFESLSAVAYGTDLEAVRFQRILQRVAIFFATINNKQIGHEQWKWDAFCVTGLNPRQLSFVRGSSGWFSVSRKTQVNQQQLNLPASEAGS